MGHRRIAMARRPLLAAACVAAGCGGVPEGSVLRLRIDGELHERASDNLLDALQSEGGRTVLELTQAIRRAAKDEAIIGLLLDVKEPAYGLAQIEEVADAVAAFRDSGKWSVAFLETAGELSRGDGAYALAVCAEEVVLSPVGEINLGGVQAEVPFVKGTLEKLHIHPYVDKRFEYKTAANAFTHERLTEPHRQALQGIVDDLQQSLVAHIATRRGVTPAEVTQWYATTTHLAAQARERGLVDKMAYYDGVLEQVLQKTDRENPFIDLDGYLSARRGRDSGPQMALIFVAGQITRGTTPSAPFGSQRVAGSDTVATAFRDARKAKVKGVLLRVDSPGGSYVASDVIRREVEVTRDAGIPVVVSMGNTAASGGYLVSLQASHIVAQPTTVTGSIGVFTGILAMRDFFRSWLGVTFDGYEAVPQSATPSWLDPPTAAVKASITAELDRIYEEFVTKAATARGKPYAAIDAVARGRVWSGRAALEHGLVDELGGIDKAVDKLRELAGLEPDTTVSLVTYPQPKKLLEILTDLFATRTDPGAELGTGSLRELVALWHRLQAGAGDTLAFAPLHAGLSSRR